MPAKKTTKANEIETQARISKDNIKLTGKNTRAKGHLSATVKRQQAKRDNKG